jgi:hypothetical protein
MEMNAKAEALAYLEAKAYLEAARQNLETKAKPGSKGQRNYANGENDLVW